MPERRYEMLDAKLATRELIVAAGDCLHLGLDESDIALLVSVTQPLFGSEIFVVGREEVEAIAIPDNPNTLARWSTIGDSRYLNGATQIILMTGVRGLGAERQRQFQNALALVFHAVLAK